jgi:hypothetical protein
MPAELIVKKFESPLQFLNWSKDAPVIWKGTLESHTVSTEKTEWTRTENFDEAYHLAKFGWPEGLKLLQREVLLADVALAENSAMGRRKLIGIEGHSPDIPRAVAGEVLNMVRRLKQKTDRQGVVKIRYDMGRLADVSPDTILRLGGALCSYINMLEAINYSVQLDACFETEPSHDYGGPNVSFQFPLKKAGTPLAMVDLVFWLAHPSALRRIKFAAMERLDIERYYSPGYGRSRRITEVPADTLYLRIDDARYNVKQCLENIRSKHMIVLEPHTYLAGHLKKLEFV